jgi:ATP-dependent RNA helicase DeaD
MSTPAGDPTGPTTGADATAPEAVTFKRLGLRNQLLRTLAAEGYDEPTPIQREAIPPLMAGNDLLGQAATGTGKTAAFALPILHAIGRGRAGPPQALVIAPTRELAMQVAEAVRTYGANLGTGVVAVVGGQPVHRQVAALARGAHVVVATPGRAVDLIDRGALDLSAVATVVLDEADEMLDMGFEEDLDRILDAAPPERQTVMFSATVPRRIADIAARRLRDPVRVAVEARGTTAAGDDLVRETLYWVHRSHKAAALGRILDVEAPESAVVFCRTRVEVDELTVEMNARGHRAEALHGGMDQPQRDRVMARLREGTATLLLATDVAARGLDVDVLTHVINHDVPSQAEQYVHRIGRVGRAGRTGVAITLAEPRDRRNITFIERLTGRSIPVARLPSVADLRDRQVAATVAALRDSLDADDLADYVDILEELSDNTPRDVALAAIRLLHEADRTAADEQEIPDAFDVVARRKQQRTTNAGAKGMRGGGRDGGERRRHLPEDEIGWLFVNLGRIEGVRPGDLVGAIANEAGIPGRDIGPIKIAQHHSKVGVPLEERDGVLARMRTTTVRGKKATVRKWME